MIPPVIAAHKAISINAKPIYPKLFIIESATAQSVFKASSALKLIAAITFKAAYINTPIIMEVIAKLVAFLVGNLSSFATCGITSKPTNKKGTIAITVEISFQENL